VLRPFAFVAVLRPRRPLLSIFFFSCITYFFYYLKIPGLSTVAYTPLLCSFLQRQVGLFLISSSCRRKLTMTLLMDIIPFWVWGVMMLSNWVRLGQKKRKKSKCRTKPIIHCTILVHLAHAGTNLASRDLESVSPE
jgi:hypothetical protein